MAIWLSSLFSFSTFFISAKITIIIPTSFLRKQRHYTWSLRMNRNSAVQPYFWAVIDKYRVAIIDSRYPSFHKFPLPTTLVYNVKK